MTSEYIAGDDIEQAATLYQNKAIGEVLQIPSNATLKAYATDPKRRKVIISAVTILDTDPGNNWTAGEISFTFNKSTTAILADYDGDEIHVAIQLTIDGKQRTFKATRKAVKMPLNVI